MSTHTTLQSVRSVHLVGIGGAGVSALARFFARSGVRVSGTDSGVVHDSEALKSLGVEIGDRGVVPENTELLVCSPAVPAEDEERTTARARGILELSYPEALGALMADRYGIAVSGTNGKTTTTALLGLMLAEGGLDPTVVVGGTVPAWQGNFRFGKSDLFVAEGCEYRRHMLKLSPQMIVLTNIAADHLDYYRDIDDIKSAFTEYVQMLPEDGVLVCNADDEQVRDVLSSGVKACMVGFSLREGGAELYAKSVRTEGGAQHFVVVHKDQILGEISTRLPGDFNRANILAAIAAALDRGVSFEAIKKAVADFGGVRRRFEYVCEYRGAPVISDYAHHPDAVRGTIEATRELYPHKKIIAVFQPHQTDRTIKLFDGFVSALVTADEVVLPEIYQVAGREDGQHISSNDLVQAIHKERPGIAHYAKDLHTAQTMIENLDIEEAVLLVMGAGDVDNLARALRAP